MSFWGLAAARRLAIERSSSVNGFLVYVLELVWRGGGAYWRLLLCGSFPRLFRRACWGFGGSFRSRGGCVGRRLRKLGRCLRLRRT